MAIRGRLDELQASEVLQFLTQSGQSGILRFDRGRWSKSLAFENGRLIYGISHHQLPPIAEILHQRGLVESLRGAGVLDVDEHAIAALEWRRDEDGVAYRVGTSPSRLGRVMVAGGHLAAGDLATLLEPASMPEDILGEALVVGGVMTRDAVDSATSGQAGTGSLYEAALREGGASSEQIGQAIACMPESCLGRLLIESGKVKAAEVRYCLERLTTLQAHRPRGMGRGDYMLAVGELSQLGIKRALTAQLTAPGLLAEILIEQDATSAEELDEVDREVEEIRLAFSPLASLRQILKTNHGFTDREFAKVWDQRRESGNLFSTALAEAGCIAEADLRQEIESLLAGELSDLMLWQDGDFEFFEGYTLADATGEIGLDRIHGFSFEVSSLLLDAHYRIDELRRTSFRRLGPETILRTAGALSAEIDLSPGEVRLLHRMDGQQPLGEVCAVLPLNQLAHRSVVARFLEHGWVTPLTREEGFERGVVVFATGRETIAQQLFEHALSATGAGPGDAEIRLWIDRCRVASEGGRLLAQLLLGVRSKWFQLTHGPSARRVFAALRRQEYLSRPVAAMARGWGAFRERARLTMRRATLITQDFMIQKGLSRRWWDVRRRVTRPGEGIRGQGAKIATGLAAAGVLGAMMIPGVARLDPSPSAKRTPDSVRLRDALRVPEWRAGIDAPVESPPALAETAMFVAARDGVLRCLPLDESDPAPRWQQKLGEYGDLLSTPTLCQDRLFVANVRGLVHAVRTDGELLWSHSFPRVERIAPTMAFAEDGTLAGVVIAARESMFVLHPEDGRILYRLQCGNVIAARPVVSGERVYVGSADNHVYCSNWRTKKVLWDAEVGEDVLSLILLESRLVALIRGGSLVTLKAMDGRVDWRHKHDTQAIRGVRIMAGGRLAIELADGGAQTGDITSGTFEDCARPLRADSTARLMLMGSRRIYYSEVGVLGEVDARGEDLWRCDNGLERITSVSVQGDRLVVTSGSGGVWAFSMQQDPMPGVRQP